MSFQGDVAGIGLGELLQGLCRGGRDGVLTLDGDGDLTCFLGLEDAQICFLPGPMEDTDLWRNRCQQAWADMPDQNFENQRRLSIAHAARRETLFEMLEASNLHFRFEPGPLPSTTPSMVREDSLDSDQAEAPQKASPWGPTYSVEYLLLEHARIFDESHDTHARDLTIGDMPRALEAKGQSEEVQLFLDQCNGSSTVEEISDRLGWPVRQTRGLIGQHIAAGFIRLADHRELMVAAQRELELGRVGRAAQRLARWIEQVPPGPIFQEGEAELLLGEWRAERLTLVLNVMAPKLARGVLRRLDYVSTDREDRLERWKNLALCNRRDPIIAFKCAVLSALPEASAESEDVASELVKMARSMQDMDHPWRARALLRLGATQVYEKLTLRLELGNRMVQVGLIQEAEPWILDAARELIACGQAEKAIPPLRALAQSDADQREASGLLIQARAHKTNLRRRRRNTLIGMSLVLILVSVALVRVKAQEKYDEQVESITKLLHQPESALALMQECFGDDQSPRVASLREALETQLKDNQRNECKAWLAEYRQIEQEIEYGDSILGLRHALELAPMPPYQFSTLDRPERADLLGMLASRMELASEGLPIRVDASKQDLADEQRVLIVLDSIKQVTENFAQVEGVENFNFFIDELGANIRERQEKRAEARVKVETKYLEEQQDLMLAGARAHAQAGDLTRAVKLYDRLLALAGSEELRPLLRKEVEQVRSHEQALERALELSREGHHDQARAALEGICPDLSEHILPWRVDSTPSGARVTFRGDTVRVTPFVLYSAIGERIDLTLTHDGCVQREISLDAPEDLNVFMHRLPERSWGAGEVVSAAPVPIGKDHIVFDRSGRAARLKAGTEESWSISLDTLGGIARTPVFLSRKPGYLLVLSEDGQVWFLRASDGEVTGPYDFGSPPVEGPLVTRSGISARFADGRVGLWSDNLEPQIFEDEGLFQSRSLQSGDSNDENQTNLSVMRRTVDSGTQFSSPWSNWEVEVTDQYFRVFDDSAVVRSFTVARSGDWNYVAWEAPNALLPDGRLWISDGAGLQSFRPEGASEESD